MVGRKRLWRLSLPATTALALIAAGVSMQAQANVQSAVNAAHAKFKDLKAISYFVLAKKGDKNNFGGGEQTGKLEAKRINKVTIVIE